MLMTFYSLQENSEFLQRKYRNFYMFMKKNMSLNRCKDFYNLKLIVMELITCGSVFFCLLSNLYQENKYFNYNYKYNKRPVNGVEGVEGELSHTLDDNTQVPSMVQRFDSCVSYFHYHWIFILFPWVKAEVNQLCFRWLKLEFPRIAPTFECIYGLL